MPLPKTVLGIYSAKATDFPEAGALSTLDKSSMLHVFRSLENLSIAVLGVEVVRFDSLGRPSLNYPEMWYLHMEPRRHYSTVDWFALCVRSLVEAHSFVVATSDSPANIARFIAQFMNLSEYKVNLTRPQKRFGRHDDVDVTI